MRRDLPFIAFLFALPLILFWPQTMGGKTLLPTENLYQFEPYYTYRAEAGAPDRPHNHLLDDLVLQNLEWKSYARETFAQGEIPLWNPHQFSGIPFMAAGQQQVFYPLSLINYLLPLPASYGWFMVVNLWLAGAFMYVFARTLGASRLAATLAAVTYELCGMFVASAVHPMIVGTVVWLPLMLTMAECILRQRPLMGRDASPLWAAIGGVALAFSVLSGHAEITIYNLLITGYFSAARLAGIGWARRGTGAIWRGLAGRSAWLVALVVLGLTLSAVQLIPLVEFVQTNWRAERSDLAQVLDYAHKPRNIIQFVLPNFYGSPAHHGYYDIFTGSWQAALTQPDGRSYIDWGIKNYVEGALYVGIVPLVLAAVALFAPKTPARPAYRLIFAALGAASLTFMFGLPTYALMYALPGINQLNTPFRWVYGVTVAVAVLAAFGADALLSNARLARRTGWLLLTAGGLTGAGLAISRVTFDVWASSAESVLMGMVGASQAFSDIGMFYSYILPQVVLLAFVLVTGGLLMLALGRGGARRKWAGAGVVVLVAADLMAASWGFNPASDPALLEYVPPAVAFLRDQPGEWRYTVLNAEGQRDILNANVTMRYGIDDVRGYDSIISRQYVDYMRGVHEQGLLQFNRIAPLAQWMPVDDILNSDAFKRLNVRYLVTHPVITLGAEGWTLAYEDAAVRIYEDTRMISRAYLLADPEDLAPLREGTGGAGLRAEVIDSTGREKSVRIETDGAAWLILSETHATGWKAFIRPEDAPESAERELPVQRVAGNFIGTLPPDAGAHVVRFIYSPSSFQVGAFATVIGAALALLSGGVWFWRALFVVSGADGSASRLARNSFGPIILNLFNRAIDFAFAAVMFRILGTERAGQYYYAIVVFGWFDIFTNFGLDLYLMREAGKARARAAALFASTSVFRLILVVAGVPLLAAFLLIRQSLENPLDASVLLTIALFYVGLIPGSLSKGLTSLYYAFERAEFPALVTTLTTISKVTGGVLALLMGWGVVGLAAVSIVTNFITLAVLIVGARQMLAESRETRPSRADIRRMAGQSWPLMLNHFLATVFFQIDIILLEAMKGERIVGLYRVAYSWLLALNVVPAFFTQALMATMSRQAGSDPAALRLTYQLSIKLLVSIALPFAIAFTLLAEPLTWLLGGSAYLPDGQIALQIMIWSIPIGWMNSLTQYALVALELQRRVTYAFAAACVFNIAANLIFIPQYGYQAAAVTTILSELLLCIGFARLMQSRLGKFDWSGMLWKPYAAALVMGASALVIQPLLGGMVAVVAASAVYLAVLIGLRPLDAGERQRVAPALPARLQRLLG